jgi:hypothetical protein
MSATPPKSFVDRLFYALFRTAPQGFFDRVFHGLMITGIVGFVGWWALIIAYAFVKVPKELSLVALLLLLGSFTLMLVLGGLQWLVGWWSARMQKGFVEGFLGPFFKGLAVGVGVLFLLILALSLGEEYGLLKVAPVLYKWLGGLIVGAIVTILVMIMISEN